MTFHEILTKCAEGLTQEELAHRLGLTQSWVSRLMRGEVVAGKATIQAVARAFPEHREELAELFLPASDGDA